MSILAQAAALAFLALTPKADGAVKIEIDGVRNTRGTLHLCLTREPAHFPDCGSDPEAIKKSVPASTRQVSLTVSPAQYALSVFHDEDGDLKLDTTLGIPREGFGFSRNPRVRFGPPRFRDVRIAIPAGASLVSVRMQYLL